MKRVEGSVVVPGRAEEAEALWLDPARWASWVEGFSHVVVLDGEWPRPGSRLRWSSVPRGRGLVEERALQYAPAERIVAAVEDSRLAGIQEVAFAEGEEEVRVTLALSYELKERTFPLVDRFFVRRALQDSVRRTVARFANERRAELLG
jgi:Polyketide cyclase / dehydrase and lipid transport